MMLLAGKFTGSPLCCLQIIGSWRFDWRYMVRGLTIDKQRGNILKIDRHKYVKIAYHGFQELPREERRAIYSNTNVNLMPNSLSRALLFWKFTREQHMPSSYYPEAL